MPWLIGFMVFVAGPIVFSLGLTLCKWSILAPPRFVGVENWVKFLRDPIAWQSVINTLYYMGGSVPLSMFLALILALLINKSIKGVQFFRALLYMPTVVTGVSMAIIWMWVFQPDYGLANDLLAKVGIQGPRWLGSTAWAMPSIIIMSLWSVGIQMVIFLAGLQDIPAALYEAAGIDGASSLDKFKFITIPGLSPVIFFNLIINIIFAFRIFDPIYVMTMGGPANSTLVMALYLYKNGFVYFRFGYAATISCVLLAITLTLVILALKSSKFWVYYRGAG